MLVRVSLLVLLVTIGAGCRAYDREYYGSLVDGASEPTVDGACLFERALCGNQCVDLTNDPLHCGACTSVCRPTQQCVAAACVALVPGDAGNDAVAGDVVTMETGVDATTRDVPMDAPRDVGVIGTDATIDARADAPVTDAPTADVRPDVPAMDVPCIGVVVINEVNAFGEPPTSDFRDEFVELYNPSSCDMRLTGWTVTSRDATTVPASTVWFGTMTDVIRAHGFFVIGGLDFSGTPNARFSASAAGSSSSVITEGAVGLYNASHTLMDSVGYGSTTTNTDGLVEGGMPSSLTSNGTASVGRLPDGHDTNHNAADLVHVARSPGAPN